MNTRLKTIGVMGASEGHLNALEAEDPESARRSRRRAGQLGALLATRPVHLLTGGGGGLMREVCAGFSAVPGRKGQVIGVIPGPEPRPGYPNEFVEILIRTHLPGVDPMAETSRNHINILSSDLIIALPGGPGTHAEVRLAQSYGRPLCLWLDADEQIDGLDATHFATAGVPSFQALPVLEAWLDSH